MKKLLSIMFTAVLVVNLAGCGSKKVTYTIDQVKEAIEASGVEKPAVMTSDEAEAKEALIETTYASFGDKAILDNVSDFYIEKPMMSFGTWEIHILDTKDGKAADVQKSLEDYLAKKIENDMMYPSTAIDYQNAKVLTVGNMVVLVAVSEEMDDQDAGKTPNLNKIVEAIKAIESK